MSVKLKRQNKIKEILNSKVVTSQEFLVNLLKAEGIEVTQATLSRDFAELGVIRSFINGGVRYIINSTESGKQIEKLIGFEIISIEHNESLIVIRSLAGRAQGVAHYIDRLNKPEILGTVGGDDTVLIIPSSSSQIPKIIKMIKELMNAQNA